MMHRVLMVLIPAILIAGCRTPSGNTPTQKRTDVEQMRKDTLSRLHAEVPSTRQYIRGAPGYATFTNISSKIFLLSSGHGFGVVVNNRTGKRTYMRMAEVGAGLGFGLKDWRAVIIFDDVATMENFVSSGWDFGADVEATAKTSDIGAGFSRSLSVQGMTIFTFTLHGLAAEAKVGGTKYWLDDELN